MSKYGNVVQPSVNITMAWDTYQIKNLVGRFAYYRMQGNWKLAVKELWSEREDISWGTNAGFYVGRESVSRYIMETVSDSDYRFDHYYSSYLIEIAADSRTAKGLFYSPGTASFKKSALWAYERCAIDFVFERGQWRIWHFCAFTDFTTPVGQAYSGDREIGKSFCAPDIPMTKEASALISTEYGYAMSPVPPVPYRSFEETFSYGPEGLMQGGDSIDG